MTNIDLSGKTAIITGATGQLGRVMATTLAQAGANIIVHCFSNTAKAQELVAEISAMGVKAIYVKGDITKEADVAAIKAAAVKAFGHVDIVVNNAVSQYTWKHILDQPLEDFSGQFEACTMQGVLMAKAFIPPMQNKKEGRFIGINTECSGLYNENSGAYAAAKRGMDGLYRVLAKEIGPSGVTVNQISPGWTISDNDRQNGTEIAPEYSKNVPLARRGTDQEIANVVLFLASDLSSYVTGVNIPVCGGTVMV